MLRLRQLFGLRTDAAIARELRRSTDGLQRMALRLFPPSARTGPWTAREELELRRYLGSAATEVIARILGRRPEDVEARIAELGRIRQEGSWTRLEILEFKHLYAQRQDEDLVRIFGRSLEEIHARARELALSKDKAFVHRLGFGAATRMPRWRRDELELLVREYSTHSNLELALRLGRSVKSVLAQGSRLGLKKARRHLSRMGRENIVTRYGGRSSTPGASEEPAMR